MRQLTSIANVTGNWSLGNKCPSIAKGHLLIFKIFVLPITLHFPDNFARGQNTFLR